MGRIDETLELERQEEGVLGDDLDALIKTNLDMLAELEAKIEVLRLDQEAQKKLVTPPELQAVFDDLEAEYGPLRAEAQARIDAMTEAIKAMVVRAGHTVPGERLLAVYSRRTNWDGKALAGYAEAHPEIKKFRTIGDPSVSLRKR